MSIGIKPLGARVIIEQVEVEKKTQSGIVLAGTTGEKPNFATVVAAGPGTEDEPMELKEGDRIVYAQYAGTPIKHNGVDYIIMQQRDILAVFED
ncbi:MAG: co-chaperone GroES [Eubacterium sp.]|nr:co-chaperone GroES [Candidatus Colimonas fimequi]